MTRASNTGSKACTVLPGLYPQESHSGGEPTAEWEMEGGREWMWGGQEEGRTEVGKGVMGVGGAGCEGLVQQLS